MQLSRRDKIVTAILLLVIALLAYLMQCHWRNRFGAGNDAKPVGHVEYKYHQVQRKYSDRMLWEDIESKSPIYAYDWVMTKDKSDARITLNNGMKVDMDPESMVEIDENRDGVGLTLRDGTIRADSRGGKKGSITAADGTKIDLDSADAQITSGAQGTSVDVKSGNATVKAQGKESKIGAGEIGSVSNGAISREKTVILLKSPAQGTVIEDASKPVNFAFDAPAGSDDCSVLLSAEKVRRSLKASAGSVQATLADGSYQWRVTCKQGGQNISSASGAFRVRPAASFALVAPERGQVIPANQAETLALSWRGGGRVKVDVSEIADFSSPVKSAEVSGNEFIVKNLKPGKYYWRVAPRGDMAQAIQSTFTISDKGELLTETDATAAAKKQQSAADLAAAQKKADAEAAAKKKSEEEKKAADKAKATKAEKIRLTARGPGSVTIEPDAISANVNLSWKPAAKSYDYRIRIGRERGLAKPVAVETVSGKGQATLALKPGVYYYRVDVLRKGTSKVLGSSSVQKTEVKQKKLPPPPRVKSVQAE